MVKMDGEDLFDFLDEEEFTELKVAFKPGDFPLFYDQNSKFPVCLDKKKRKNDTTLSDAKMSDKVVPVPST